VLKRILAIASGFVLWSVLWICYNVLLQKLAVTSGDMTTPMTAAPPLLALLLGSFVISGLSGYLTARIDGTRSSAPIITLGVLLLVVGIYFQSQYWHVMPLWYHLIFLALLIPMCFVGARLAAPRVP
jgi:hypothetical protein